MILITYKPKACRRGANDNRNTNEYIESLNKN